MECWTGIAQKRIIEDLNLLIEGMNKEEFNFVCTEKLFIKISKMIVEKKIQVEKAILVLKHMGYLKMLKSISGLRNGACILCARFEIMIEKEEKKKKEKDEKLLLDLYECCLLLEDGIVSKLLQVCVPCLRKAASNREENEEVQKEVEMALLALSNIKYDEVRNDLYLNEIKEIIVYHQELWNLIQLAYQSAWGFLTNGLLHNANLEEVIVNNLHFVREVGGELEELTKCVDWKREKEERGKEGKEEILILKWLQTLGKFLFYCRLRNEEYSVLVESIVQAFRAAKDNYRDIVSQYIKSFCFSVNNRNVKVEGLLKSC
ncbi:uncharacterized protein MONOS_18694 [Monocercomonoides exilis]|uniref:uncharacterized protein n=1 Tax=Monocercomonoides exilis TaxID=2049356 RepID=UPI0035596578|nr:hypothetical protein MONOS_18694 [Monocercomonoides exilis]